MKNYIIKLAFKINKSKNYFNKGIKLCYKVIFYQKKKNKKKYLFLDLKPCASPIKSPCK